MFYLCSVPPSPWPQQSLFNPMMSTGQILEHVPAIQACLQHTSLCWRGSQFAAIFANHSVLLAFGAVVDWKGKEKIQKRKKELQGVEKGNFLICNFISEAVIYFPLSPLAFTQKN